jgi:hypothetical protein
MERDAERFSPTGSKIKGACSFTSTPQMCMIFRQKGLLYISIYTSYKTIILPVALYGSETWSLTLREEHGLREFENSVLRRIFGPKRNEIIRGWRKLHNEELQNVYY